MYYDLRINRSDLYIPFTNGTDVACELDFFKYKYMYNPNLVAPFNRTRLPHTVFANLAIGDNFIIKPKFSNLFEDKISLRMRSGNSTTYGFVVKNNTVIPNTSFGYTGLAGEQFVAVNNSFEDAFDKGSTRFINQMACVFKLAGDTTAVTGVDATTLFTAPAHTMIPNNNIIVTKRVIPHDINFDERMLMHRAFNSRFAQQIFWIN